MSDAAAEVSVQIPAARPGEEELDRSLRPQLLDDFVGQEQVKSQLGALHRGRPPPRRAARPRAAGRAARASARPRSRTSPRARSTCRWCRPPARRWSARATSPRSSRRSSRARCSSSTRSTGSPARSRRRSTRRWRTAACRSCSARAPGARTVTLDLPPFTLIGATTRTGLLTTPLRERFGVCHRLEHYPVAGPGARSSCARPTSSRVEIDERGRRRRSPPARAARRASPTGCCERVRDFAEVRSTGTITRGGRRRGAGAARGRLGRARAARPRDPAHDRREVRRRPGRASPRWPIAVGEERDTIEDVYEPYLLQRGLIKRTPRGRVATRARLRAPRPRAATAAHSAADASLF